MKTYLLIYFYNLEDYWNDISNEELYINVQIILNLSDISLKLHFVTITSIIYS